MSIYTVGPGPTDTCTAEVVLTVCHQTFPLNIHIWLFHCMYMQKKCLVAQCGPTNNKMPDEYLCQDVVLLLQRHSKHVYWALLCGEGFSPLGETAPRRGKRRRSRPLSLSLAPPTAPVLVVSSISVVGGSSGGGALRKPSLCKQQSSNAKIKIIRDEMLRS